MEKTSIVYRMREVDELNDLLEHIISRKGDVYRFGPRWQIFDSQGKTVGRVYEGRGSPLFYEVTCGNLEEVVEEYMNLNK